METIQSICEVEASRGSDKYFHDMHTDNTEEPVKVYKKTKTGTKDHTREADYEKNQDKNVYMHAQHPEIHEEKKMDKDEDPCWKGYEMVGTKKKKGKEVPNCVPVKEGRFSSLVRKSEG